jgi:hypothetical protein
MENFLGLTRKNLHDPWSILTFTAPMQSGNLRKLTPRPIPVKQLYACDRWEKFCVAQCGVYPASLAAVRLGMTPQGVFQASERGWIAFFALGKKRFYGAKDVILYAQERSRKRIGGALSRNVEPKRHC